MTTLHALRRNHKLSLSELALLTGIPARRLAEYEYEERPLGWHERQALARVFDVSVLQIGAGMAAAVPISDGGRLQPQQAYLLSALAATTALSLSLWQVAPSLPSVTFVQPARPALSAPTSLPESPPRPSPPARAAGVVLPKRTELSAAAASTAPVAPTAALPTPTTALPTSTNTPPTATTVPTSTPEPVQPHRCPVVTQHGHIVVTQGYGTGTHVPTGISGAIDLAVDFDGNGLAEPSSTRGAIVVAAHAGIVKVDLGTWPAGNHIWVEGSDGWRSGYSHLQVVSVKTGDTVVAGQQLGVVGNTGRAGGPHLEIQVWRNGQNIDPTSMLPCR